MQSSASHLLTWVLFFSSSVYGHVAFKWAANDGEEFNLWRVLFSFWGLSAGFAWMLSGILWLLILSKNPLFTANSISALRYALLVLSALLFFKEAISYQQGIGIVMIMIGIYLVAR